MPDIFDEIAPEPSSGSGDIFDQVAPEPAAEPGIGKPRSLWNSLVRGVKTAQAIPEVIQAAGTANMGKPSVRQERKAYVAAMSDPMYQERLMQAGDNPARLAQVETTRGPSAKLGQIMAPAQALQTETARDLAASQAEIQAIQQSPAQQRLGQAKNSKEKWGVWLKDPVELTAGIVLESLPPSVAGATIGTIVGGPGAGTAAGAGLSSAAMTFSSEFLGAASQQGVDIANPAALEAFLNNKRAFDTAFNAALSKSVIVGGVDASTAGLAGRWIAPALQQGLRQRVIASGKELAMQMAGGAGGEAAGQVVSGQQFDPFDAAMEALAEVATAPGEAAGNIMAKRATPVSVAQKVEQTVKPDIFDQVSQSQTPESSKPSDSEFGLTQQKPPGAVQATSPAPAASSSKVRAELEALPGADQDLRRTVPALTSEQTDAGLREASPEDAAPVTKGDLKALVNFFQNGGPNPFAAKPQPVQQKETKETENLTSGQPDAQGKPPVTLPASAAPVEWTSDEPDGELQRRNKREFLNQLPKAEQAAWGKHFDQWGVDQTLVSRVEFLEDELQNMASGGVDLLGALQTEAVKMPLPEYWQRLERAYQKNFPQTITGSNVQTGTAMPVSPQPAGGAIRQGNERQGNEANPTKVDFIAPETPAAQKIEIKNGDTVSVVTRAGAKPRNARVVQMQPDGSASVVVAGEQTTRMLSASQIQPSRRAVTLQAKTDELAGFAPEQQTQIKTRAAEFRQLVADYAPQLEWTPAEAYDESFGADTKDVGFRKAELRTNAIRQAMRAVFPNGQENSQVDQANALPKLEAYLRQQFPGDNSVAKRRTLEEFGRSETPPQETAAVERDQATLDQLAARRPNQPEFRGLRAVGRSVPRGQRAVRERGAGPGVLSSAGASAVTELERIFGVRIIFVENAPFNGVRIHGTNLVLISAKSPRATMAIAGHELLHHIKATHPGLYADFVAQARALLKNSEQFRAELARKGYSNLTEDVVTEEMFADVLGDAVLDPAFLQQLAKSEPNLFKRFARTAVTWLQKLIAKAKALTGFDSAQYVTDLTEMREQLLNLLREAGRQTQFERAGIQQKETEDTEQGQDAFARQRMQLSNATITSPGLVDMGDRFSLTAHHGTPHKVDKFTTAKIGTGEGAQVYGWGLYFAENEKVAEDYKKNLTEREFISKVRELYDEFSTPEDALSAINDPENKFSEGQRRLLQALQKEDWLGFDYPHQAVQAAIREPENVLVDAPETRAALNTFGNKYTVSLNVDPADLLDWDKPLSEQSEKVRNLLANNPQIYKAREQYRRSGGRESTARDIYHAMASELEFSGSYKDTRQVASEYLRKHGIKGIRYLDQGSRKSVNLMRETGGTRWAVTISIPAQQPTRKWFDTEREASDYADSERESGTFNYVIFSDDDITITHENGQEVGARDMFSLEGGDMFGFDAPESVGEQKQRIKNEELRMKKSQARDAMQERAGARLVGQDLDTTQEMFGAEVKRDKAGQGDMFSKEKSEFAKLQADITAAEAELMTAIRNHMTPPDGVRKAEALKAKNDASAKLNRLLVQQLKLMTSANVDAARSPEQTAEMISQTVDLLNSLADEVAELNARSQAVPEDLTKLRQDLQTRLNMLKGWTDDQTDKAAQGRAERDKPETLESRIRYMEIEGATNPSKLSFPYWYDRFKLGLKKFTSPIPELPMFGDRARFTALFKRGYRLFAVENNRVKKEAAEKVQAVLEPLAKLGRKSADNDALQRYYRLSEKLANARLAGDMTRIQTLAEQLHELEQTTLNKDPFNLFRRMVLYRDFYWRGTYLKNENGKPITLPGGLTADEVLVQLRKLTKAISEHPDGLAITEALRRHYALMEELRKSIIDHGEIIPESLNNPTYFPHLLSEYYSDNLGRVNPTTEESFRKYLMTPVGSDKLIQTDYIKAVLQHTAEVLSHNARADLVAKYWATYDVSEQLKEQHGDKWDHAYNLPPGYALYAPYKKLPLRATYILPRDVLANQLGVLFNDGDLRTKMAGKVVKVTPEDLRTAMVAGEKIKWALPKEIVDALHGIEKREAALMNQPGHIGAAAGKVVRAGQNIWKKLKLFGPTSFARYTFGNLTTDAIDKVLAGDPKIAAQMRRAARELWNADAGDLSAEYKAAAREGVFETVTAAEVGELEKIPEFKEFLTTGQIRKVAADKVLGAPAALNSFRESVFRYAKFLADVERLRAGEELPFTGMYHKDIDALGAMPTGKKPVLEGDELIYARAGENSLKHFGDYAMLAVNTQWLRRYLMPFVSWTDVNLRYHATLAANMVDAFKPGASETQRVHALRISGAKIALTLGLIGLGKELWNQVGGPLLGLWADDDDLENKLSPADRRRGHIILGKDDKGEVMVIYTPSAWGDVAEWVGGQNFKRLFLEFARGEITLDQWLVDYTKQVFPDFANKLLQSAGPAIKGPYELMSGKSVFPDFFDQRTIAKSEKWWRFVGTMTDDRIAGWVRGVFDEDYYTQPMADQLQQIVLQVRRRDPEQWAFFEVKDKVADWEFEKTGKRFSAGDYSAPEALALRNFRKAIYRGDVVAAERFYNSLLRYGYTAERLDSSIRNQAPLAGLNEEQREQFLSELSERERKQLELAEAYYARFKALDGREKWLFPRKAGWPAQPDSALLRSIIEDQKPKSP